MFFCCFFPHPGSFSDEHNAPASFDDQTAHVVNFNAAISACENAEHKPQCEQAGMTTKVLNFNSTSPACEKGGSEVERDLIVPLQRFRAMLGTIRDIHTDSGTRDFLDQCDTAFSAKFGHLQAQSGTTEVSEDQTAPSCAGQNDDFQKTKSRHEKRGKDKR